MIWATVSSWSCFCWLWWWCPCVESSLVSLEEGVCYDQCVLLAKLYKHLPCFWNFYLEQILTDTKSNIHGENRKYDDQEIIFLSQVWHALKRESTTTAWGPRMATTWFHKWSFSGSQSRPFADMLPLVSFVLQQETWEVTTDPGQHTAGCWDSWLIAKKKKKRKKEKKTMFADSCPKKTENHRTQWWKDNTSQSGDASRGWKGRGVHTGVGERKGWGSQVCRGCHGVAQEIACQLGHLRGRSSLRREHTPSLEIISKNLQTWMQVLVCIEQLLKSLFSFVHPDGPESPERRC